MLNTSLALDPEGPCRARILIRTAPSPWSAIKAALTSRPELVAGRAEIVRAEADVEVMRDMFRPMASVRTGPSYTMAEGRGWMAMVGISLPIWRDKLHAGVAEAQAMRAMSEADLRAMTRMIEGDAAVAISQLQASRDRQAALTTDVLPRARMAIEPAVAGYTAGQLPLVSVIEAVQALWLVQGDLIAADTELGLHGRVSDAPLDRMRRSSNDTLSTLRRIGAPLGVRGGDRHPVYRRAVGAACASAWPLRLSVTPWLH